MFVAHRCFGRSIATWGYGEQPQVSQVPVVREAVSFDHAGSPGRDDHVDVTPRTPADTLGDSDGSLETGSPNSGPPNTGSPETDSPTTGSASLAERKEAILLTGRRLADVEARLLACEPGSDLASGSGCRDELRQICEAYLDHLQRLLDDELTSAARSIREKAAAGDVEDGALLQLAQVETTISNLEHRDVQANEEEAVASLLEEVRRIRSGGEKLLASLNDLAPESHLAEPSVV